MAARRIVINEYDALEGAYRASSKAHVDCLLKREEGWGNCGRGINAGYAVAVYFCFPAYPVTACSLSIDTTRCLM